MSVKSPCIGVCMIDPAHDWCVGCFRTLKEITDWSKSDDAGKRDVLRLVEERRVVSAPKRICEPA